MATYVLGIYDATAGSYQRSGEVAVTDANPLPVTIAAGVSSSSKAEDEAHASGDTGVAMLAVRRDAAAVGSGTDGDYSTVNVDSTGNLWSRIGIALPAGENHVGQVGTGGNVADVTPVCDTSAYTAADVLFDSTEVANAVRVSGGRSELVSVTILDEDDNAAATMDLYFLRSNVSLGTANAAISITDANAREIIGVVPIAIADFKDLINSKLACIKNIGLMLEPTTGTSIWVAGVTGGTPTQTASGIKLRLGFKYH